MSSAISRIDNGVAMVDLVWRSNDTVLFIVSIRDLAETGRVGSETVMGGSGNKGKVMLVTIPKHLTED